MYINEWWVWDNNGVMKYKFMNLNIFKFILILLKATLKCCTNYYENWYATKK